MPTLSGVANTSFATRIKYAPVTEAQGASPPPYAFYFYPQDGFSDKFHFDNCREFRSFDPGVSYNKLKFDRQEMYYKRLFKLKRPRKQNRYYLCPWLIVPFEKQTVGTTTTYKATIGAVKPSARTIGLDIKPYSMVDRMTSLMTHHRITKNNPNGVSAHTLELYTTSSDVTAEWDSPAQISAPTIIGELSCLKTQKLTVTIGDSTSVNAYGYSSFIGIRNDAAVTVGGLNLLFVPVVDKQVVFIRVKKVASSTTQVTLEMLHGPDLLGTPFGILDDLNNAYAMSGIRFTAPADAVAGFSIKLTSVTAALTPGGIVTFESHATLDMTDDGLGPRLADAVFSDTDLINSLTWAQQRQNYLFVFLIDEIKPAAAALAAAGEKTGTTTGNTTTWSRGACVFLYAPKTLAHECAHALGLPHSFYDKSVSYSAIAANAEQYAASLEITSEQTLFEFHDTANLSGYDAALAPKFTLLFPFYKQRQRAFMLEALLHTRMYGIFQTDNLLDYQDIDKKPPIQFQLRKCQLELLRYFA